MSTNILHNRQRRLRDAAILVASLDDHLAEQLVASMPTADAAEVRMAVKHLGSIDPDEQDEIAAKFRQSTAGKSPPQLDGVELDASLLARIENQDLHSSDLETVVANNPLQTLSSEEETTVVNMLSEEHPQTISIVLSRLNPSSAANLLSKFSPNMQADILIRMANCNPADEQTVRVIESQLGQWIDQHRQQQRRMAAGFDLVQSILSNTSESQRKTVLTQLRGSDPALAGQLASKPKQNRITKEETSPPNDHKTSDLLELGIAAKSTKPPRGSVFDDGLKESDFRRQETAPSELPSRMTARPLEELDRLDDATLIAALSQSDRKVVTLALAGASDALMKRVMRGLPRRHASNLRNQLRDIGPTRLSDILAAQRQLLQNAHQLMAHA